MSEKENSLEKLWSGKLHDVVREVATTPCPHCGSRIAWETTRIDPAPAYTTAQCYNCGISRPRRIYLEPGKKPPWIQPQRTQPEFDPEIDCDRGV